MARSDVINHFYRLSKWAIKTVLTQNEHDGDFCLLDLRKAMEKAWFDLRDDGELEQLLYKDGEET